MNTWKQQWSLTVELLRAKCWARCFISTVPFNTSSVVETTLTPILQLRKLKIREIKLLLFPGPLSWLVAEMELEPMAIWPHSMLIIAILNAEIHFPVIIYYWNNYFMTRFVSNTGNYLIWFYLLDICFLIAPKKVSNVYVAPKEVYNW